MSDPLVVQDHEIDIILDIAAPTELTIIDPLFRALDAALRKAAFLSECSVAPLSPSIFTFNAEHSDGRIVDGVISLLASSFDPTVFVDMDAGWSISEIDALREVRDTIINIERVAPIVSLVVEYPSP